MPNSNIDRLNASIGDALDTTVLFLQRIVPWAAVAIWRNERPCHPSTQSRLGSIADCQILAWIMLTKLSATFEVSNVKLWPQRYQRKRFEAGFEPHAGHVGDRTDRL
jgi:hypothetical protein